MMSLILLLLNVGAVFTVESASQRSHFSDPVTVQISCTLTFYVKCVRLLMCKLTVHVDGFVFPVHKCTFD